jgi:NAD(P)H-hydrate epimerase
LFADETVVLGYPKPGLFNMPGAERVGRIKIVDIGIPPDLAQEGVAELMTASFARSLLPRRPIVANKGTFGKVMVVAGSTKYIGAACLACTGALRVGAGLVTLATPASLQAIMASKLTEVTYLPLSESRPGQLSPEATSEIRSGIQDYDVLLVGCGLGRYEATVSMIKSLLLGREALRQTCVVDADALNILGELGLDEQVWRRLGSDAILTPHPGEMSRLTGVPVEEIQRDRLATAARAAREWHKTVVLKGAYTAVAAADGRIAVSPFATAAMASAGTGDVLAGAIAGFAAQGLAPFEAAMAGVYVHGKAGELVSRELGEAGVVAGDIQQRLPAAIKETKGG